MFDRIVWSHLVLGFCFLGDFWSQLQFQCLWLACSYFLFLPSSVLGDCTFLGICSFLPYCPFYWHTVVVSYDPLCFCGFSLTSLFPFLILLIWVLSLFVLMNLVKGLSVLFIFSKHQLLVSLIFAIVSFVSVWFVSVLLCYGGGFFP